MCYDTLYHTKIQALKSTLFVVGFRIQSHNTLSFLLAELDFQRKVHVYSNYTVGKFVSIPITLPLFLAERITTQNAETPPIYQVPTHPRLTAFTQTSTGDG